MKHSNLEKGKINMKAVYLESFGSNEVLKIGEIAKPVAAANEVLIRLSHTSVNPVDYKIRDGHLQGLLPHKLPVVLGWDAAGVIEAVGPGVSSFKPGDRVFAYARKEVVQNGTYAEYITLPVTSVAIAPKSVDGAAAAAIPLVALTAWQSLFDFADLKAGESVFIPGGSGGVGSFAIQLAKIKGARVITSASTRNKEYLKGLGADAVVDYTKDDVAAKVLEFAPNGVDVVFDCVGAETQTEAWRVVKKSGRFVSIVDSPDETFAKTLNVKSGFWFVQPDAPRLALLSELVDSGKLKLPAISVRSIKDAAKALAEVETRRVQGKIVLKIDF